MSDGLPISDLDDGGLRILTDKIILECSSITGCELPFTELFAESISNRLIEFMKKFGFSDLTLSEIILAMEININSRLRMPSGIEMEEVVFSGRCVNVTFIAKVLSNYMILRNYIYRRMQNKIDGYE